MSPSAAADRESLQSLAASALPPPSIPSASPSPRMYCGGSPIRATMSWGYVRHHSNKRHAQHHLAPCLHACMVALLRRFGNVLRPAVFSIRGYQL
ncbi:hypothetical protein K432DRAFT_430601 [Lepidopterella palustris CBS 459.81]|uniref:Uncharacterized protein n=1 Tax=Lepidopterella palustris CBS 459.81 TaxID=1314670 RepID=A0A8E2DXB6_9PEZI|nr:hypothetical protein K432DRAFT_430601 [Lepidopterella palustris CBS 459.81]